MAWLRLVDPRLLLDLLFATGLGVVVLGRVTESRTLWLLRGYLFLVALAWVVQRYANLPLTTKLVDALVLACSLALAILWQGELRRLMELLGTGRLDVLFGNSGRDGLASGSVAVLSEAAGRLSQSRRGALVLVDLGSDLRPEDFLNPGIPLDAQLSVDLLLNLFAADTPLHDGAVLVRANRIMAAGVILPLSRQGSNRYGTRHLAALGITERFDRCLCIVVSEETGTLSLACQGRLERPITSSRLHDLLSDALASSTGRSVAKDTPDSRG
ncbi:diadenylate cyclase [Synechococcus sp. CCY9201]|uniref:diadenylate cyclase n=1 Tax=unclassified Synechococcus TaxID=2626047 RepID=UPI0018CC81EC|nr:MULTISPECIES: diadenylate cyclase [unclassified Synechococcus]MEA5473968.1 diadenylate cyclase [Synechococcus sp. CCY9201]QPN58985.1 DNA integrity scanning protein DisA nucleotide-binding domain protein [Synechococcus sp. CBW1002]QPN65713.1 DNA integrity scanning protein DisA nucleotide-binding domain protein [Synechococcus sp. CBW1006]CAK6697862.1 Cyclic di-AMP synthase CdaA [Synechococcus sp. CBW1107]